MFVFQLFLNKQMFESSHLANDRKKIQDHQLVLRVSGRLYSFYIAKVLTLCESKYLLYWLKNF